MHPLADFILLNYPKIIISMGNSLSQLRIRDILPIQTSTNMLSIKVKYLIVSEWRDAILCLGESGILVNYAENRFC